MNSARARGLGDTVAIVTHGIVTRTKRNLNKVLSVSEHVRHNVINRNGPALQINLDEIAHVLEHARIRISRALCPSHRMPVTYWRRMQL